MTVATYPTELARLHAPLQARSRRTMERVLDTFTAMLATQPFEQITMAELARRSGATVTSIYARFADKRSLVLAAHERHRDATMAATAALLDPRRWRGVGLATIVHTVIARTVAYRRPRFHLLRAALLINDPDVLERAAHITRHSSECLAALLAPHLRTVPAAERARRVDFAWRAVLAVLQQRLVYDDIEAGRFHYAETEMTDRLAALFLAALRQPRGAPRPRRRRRPRSA